MQLGSTITDHKSQICRIVSMGYNDVTVECYTVFPNELAHDILHFQKDSLTIFEVIEESVYLKVHDIFNYTKVQLQKLIRYSDRLPLKLSPGMGIYKKATSDPYSSLILINRVKSETLVAETVSYIEDSFIVYSNEISMEHVDGAIEYGIDPMVTEKALKMVRLSIAAVQAII